MFKVIRIKNFRKGLATNSSSTHSIIYRNENDLFEDLNVFENDYFDRCLNNIAATREAKIKYIYHCIWHNEDLVRQMVVYYPEMKQWFGLAKAAYEDSENHEFGEHCRGEIVKNDGEDGLVFSTKYLRHIIESPDLVIVGGSDEQDFVYDTIAGHEKAPMAGNVYDWGNLAGRKNGITKNGNYYVAFGDTLEKHYGKNEESEDDEDEIDGFRYSSGSRLRFMTEDGDPIPEYPELIDLRITNKCDHGCKFCFMNSNMKEKNADIRELLSFINSLTVKTEFSIGGGNILLYPDLEKLFKTLNRKGHIVNTTINVADCDKIMKSKKIKKLFIDYVDGIGVSIFSVEDADKFDEFQEAFRGIGDWRDESGRNVKHIVMHLVPEYLGFEKTMEILDWQRKGEKHWANVLFLGYKENGRGSSCDHETFTKDQIQALFKDMYSIAIDTSFAKKYGDYIKETFSTRFSLTENEGEYSMYVDGVTMNAYKSSYETEVPYYVGWEIGVDWKKKTKTHHDVKKAFANIRKDNGFPVYVEKHYWD